MKTKYILLSLFSAWLLAGCFEDEGNYSYLPESAPTFLFKSPNHIYCYEDDTTIMKGSFRFNTSDSLERMADLSYEWKLNGVVLCTEKDFNVPTNEAMDKLGLTEYPSSFLVGTYSVIENSTGLRYMTKVLYNFIPKYGKGNWMILSKDGENSKLSYQRLIKKNNGNKVDTTFENTIGIFQKMNGEIIPGTPRKLLDHLAPSISVYSLATLVLTDKVAYEVSNENLKKAN
ncbi:MAG: PKD-like family lipoprotein, partial [Butyricimonas virosa]|nr:PKD-like family lipoprotein [Butyricimonas virosa]